MELHHPAGSYSGPAIGDVPPVQYETAYYRSINTPAPTGSR